MRFPPRPSQFLLTRCVIRTPRILSQGFATTHSPAGSYGERGRAMTYFREA